MAEYKYSTHLHKSNTDTAAYDDLHSPGDIALNPGIYRCENCGKEIAIAKSHKLPPQSHAVHTGSSPIMWRLIVFAQNAVVS